MQNFIPFIKKILGPLSQILETSSSTQPNFSKPRGFDFSRKLNELSESLVKLQEKNKLDGEVLLATNEQIITDLRSKKIEDLAQENGQDPQFMIGSISKQFFACALLKALYEKSPGGAEATKCTEVKQALQWPITRFLPENSSIWQGKMPPWAHQITVHQLLSHTSGIANYTDSDDFYKTKKSKKFFEISHSKGDLIGLILKTPLLFEPGTAYSYSNTEYVLIAEIIETITGMNLSGYVSKVLFEPLGLKNTFNPTQGQWKELKKIPECSRLVPEKYYDPTNIRTVYSPALYEDISTATGSGSIISTASDLLKWNLALHQSRIVLPDPLYQLMITPNLENYGYGIEVEQDKCGTVFKHQGSVDAFRSYLVYVPAYELSIVALTNICYDWDQVDDEYMEIVDTLSKKNDDEEECEQEARDRIYKKYPGRRGFNCIEDMIDDFLN